MKKMTGDCYQVENPRMISTKKCKSLISKMVKDETHPLYPYITTLPHGHLRVPYGLEQNVLGNRFFHMLLNFSTLTDTS